MKALAAALVILGCCSWVEANTMYSYTGDSFRVTSGVYTTEDRIAGYFVLSDSLLRDPDIVDQTHLTPGVLSYSFTDGHQTLTDLNSTGRFDATLGLNSERIVPGSTNRAWWHISMWGPSGAITTFFTGDHQSFAALDRDDWATVTTGTIEPSEGGRGTWTVTVPEPSTIVLLSVGLAGLFVYRRRKE